MADDTANKKEGRKFERQSCLRNVEKNPVTFDNICKEVILRNKIFGRNWSKKYEHLSGETFKKLLDEEHRKAGFPADTLKHKPSEDALKPSPISLKPSAFIPETTSAMVGFRSSRPECNLEFTGRWYISPRWTMEPPMEPREFRVTRQSFIFLG